MAKRLPKIITQPEFEQLFSAVERLEKYSKSPRLKKNLKAYRVAMLLGFEAGMRISEIVGYQDRVPALTKENVEVASIRIISGKGKKDRIVPRPKRLNEVAVSMLPLKIKRRTFQHFFTNLGRKVLGKEITVHTLRHGFCTHLINQGRPLHEVQMLAGHARLDTTGLYLHCNPKEAIEKAREVF